MKISERIKVLESHKDKYGDVDIEDIPELILDTKTITFKELKHLLEQNEAYGQVETSIFLKDVREFLNNKIWES